MAATLEHPHVVPVYEAGEQDGSLFIAMRFIDGRDLATEVRDHGALAPDRVARIVLQVAGALDAAHRPASCTATSSPPTSCSRAAARTSGLPHRLRPDARGRVGERADLTGQWVGTVDYAAPEQILGEPTDARSDVYALGCLAFQALTGRPRSAARPPRGCSPT